MSCLKCLPMSSANLSKEITWCLPGSTHCLSSSICLMGLMRSIWAGSQLCLSANVFLMRILLMSSRTELCVCQCLSSELNRCLPLSVSQCLLPNLSKGATWCLSGSAQCLPNGLDRRSIWAGSHLSFCQCLWWESCWCLSGLDSPVFLPMSLLVNSIDVCLKFFWCLLPNLSVFLPMSFQEEPADVCLDWARVSSFQYLSSELNRCQICFSANIFSGKVLLMSAWSFPPLVCQCLSSGSLGFLLRRASLLPSVSQQSYLSGCFLSFWWSWYPIFFSLWRVPTGCLPLGLPRFCFKTYQIFFWSSLTLIFYQDCTSATTCK